ncbi:MAG: response regulator [Chloroflexota bacterium]|nr:response regulator [Chloroflexota bacterium]
MIDALIIDDNRNMVDGLRKILSLLGVSARAAYGPRSGMMAFNEKSPDVVFLDINMPGVDGFEVFSYFKRNPEFQQTPVIVVTSDDQPETAARAEAMGAVTLILKPVSFEALESALQQAGLL